MKINAYAKINLTLELTGEVAGGYHMLKSVMHKTKLCDELEVTVTNSGAVDLICDKNLCDTQDNLAYKAATAYLGKAKSLKTLDLDTGLKITLKKNIPHGAGMGGGSADAAAVLNAANELFGAIPQAELKSIADSLGSDVSFCRCPYDCAYCTGRGEHTEQLPALPACHMLIAKPNESLSTKGIFSEYDSVYGTGENPLRVYSTDKMAKALIKGSLHDICSHISNDFEALCAKRLSQITVIKNQMLAYGAAASSMTGSGSAVFGLFDDINKAKACQKELSATGIFTFLD